MNRRDGGIVIGSALGATGAALGAALGVLCCVGPAVAAVLGAGGAAAAARLEPYRAYLLVAAFSMLAFAFWKTYQPSRLGDAACSIRTGRLAKAVLWIALFLTLGSVVVPYL